jgi:cytochrome c biogenesis protein CcdA/thiol-disulfide isomerase/thioredoxin
MANCQSKVYDKSMIILILFAFLAGIVTILSPCILPVLPIVLSSSLSGGKRRPLGVVVGFILSFTFFTLALSSLVKATGISADALRYLSIFLIALFGLALVVPKFQEKMEILLSKLSSYTPKQDQSSGFLGGIILGLSLGLIWTPCVGPIIASIITLAATNTVNLQSIFIVLAYSLGTGLPMLLITYTGRRLLEKNTWLLENTQKIQRGFGIVMILIAFAIYFNFDRSFQTYILEKFPQYGTGLTKLEDNDIVRNQLNNLEGNKDKKVLSLGKAPELVDSEKWFNSEPLKLENLKGKVVLIDFWTYTCINCIRTLPYLKNWHEKYADKGLVIIGVHTPEFEFEKTPSNVEKAIKDFGISYPVVQDNNYEIWESYSNRYWPAKYFIDKDGNIRYTHFGEGDYDDSEKMIQELLEETGSSVSDIKIDNPDYKLFSYTPETYLGYGRMAGFSSLEKVVYDKATNYSYPENLNKNNFAFNGSWEINNETSKSVKNSALKINFTSKEVFLVMRSSDSNKTGQKVKVLLDGKEIATEIAGADVKNSYVIIDSDRLYKLISLPEFGQHTLELIFEDGNVEVFAFTFG